MAMIEKRERSDGVRYRVRIRAKGHREVCATFLREKDAKNWSKKTEAEIIEGRYSVTVESTRRTVRELIDKYIREVLGKHPQKNRNQYFQLEWWKKEIGECLLFKVTPALLSECREKLVNQPIHLGTHRTPATVNRYMAAFSHCLTIASREWQWLDQNPMRKVKKLKEPRGRVRFLQADEREHLLDACRESEGLYLETIVTLAITTGMRKSEILGLRWPDVDLNNGRIIVHDTKNNERRSVPVAGPALKLLKIHSKVIRLDSDLVFPGSEDSKKLRDIRSAWENVLKKAEIQDFRFHDLRHSAASYLAMNGATLLEIAAILGHKTIQITKRYSHLTSDHLSDVMSRMTEKVFSSGG